jgi:hypothetical protein
MLIEDMGKYSQDPLGWVLYAFEWGKGELEKYSGPDIWQAEVLGEIGRQLRSGLITFKEVIRVAISSGNGPGKTCLVAWLILWAMSTFEDTRGVVTANTENQLRTKTWAEVSKWNRLSIVKHWFKVTATAIYSVNPEHEKTWRVDQIPWSDSKPESFAGLHNSGKRVLLLFDEASAIPDIIWETAEGAMTDEDTEIIWCVFGNPTRNTGRFHSCFNAHRHRWYGKHIDTRKCKYTNKDQIQKWHDDYGEDSDFFRVHVRGEFPHTSSMQFIPSDLVEIARGKHLNERQYNFAPVIIGVDNCWTGEDEGAMVLRQGLMSKILMKYRKNENDGEIAGYLAKFEDQYKADAVFIDLGWGTGVYSMGKQMGRKWVLVPFGGSSNDPGLLNKRVEMWDGIKKWLQAGGSLPDDSELCNDLVSVEYKVGETGANYGKTYLESKEMMKSRGLASPNKADALALTFAYPVKSKAQQLYDQRHNRSNLIYDPLVGNLQLGEQNLFNPLSPLAGRSLN